MLKPIESPLVNAPNIRSVSFATEVDAKETLRENKRKVKEVIALIEKSISLASSDPEQSLQFAKEAEQKVLKYFKLGTYEYCKLLAKCKINIAWNENDEELRDRLESEANILDPTKKIWGSIIRIEGGDNV